MILNESYIAAGLHDGICSDDGPPLLCALLLCVLCVCSVHGCVCVVGVRGLWPPLSVRRSHFTRRYMKAAQHGFSSTGLLLPLSITCLFNTVYLGAFIK